MINRSDIELQLGYLEAMQSLMAAQAAWNRQEGNEDSAHHCAGVAEGLGIGIVTLRCVLEKPQEVELGCPDCGRPMKGRPGRPGATCGTCSPILGLVS